MYKSAKMKTLTSEFGDIFNPNIHRINVTLAMLAGRGRHLGFRSYLRAVTEDLQRLTRFKHSKSESARKLAMVALAAYEPVLQQLMRHIDDAGPKESFKHYMQRKHFNWGRIRHGSQQNLAKLSITAPEYAKNILKRKHMMQDKIRRFYRDLRYLHITFRSKEDMMNMIAQLQEVYTYVGQLYAAYDIASFPHSFDFIFHGNDNLKNDILSIGCEPDAASRYQVRMAFEEVQRLNSDENIRARFFKEYGLTNDSMTSFFS